MIPHGQGRASCVAEKTTSCARRDKNTVLNTDQRSEFVWSHKGACDAGARDPAHERGCERTARTMADQCTLLEALDGGFRPKEGDAGRGTALRPGSERAREIRSRGATGMSRGGQAKERRETVWRKPQDQDYDSRMTKKHRNSDQSDQDSCDLTPRAVLVQKTEEEGKGEMGRPRNRAGRRSRSRDTRGSSATSTPASSGSSPRRAGSWPRSTTARSAPGGGGPRGCTPGSSPTPSAPPRPCSRSAGSGWPAGCSRAVFRAGALRGGALGPPGARRERCGGCEGGSGLGAPCGAGGGTGGGGGEIGRPQRVATLHRRPAASRPAAGGAGSGASSTRAARSGRCARSRAGRWRASSTRWPRARGAGRATRRRCRCR